MWKRPAALARTGACSLVTVAFAAIALTGCGSSNNDAATASDSGTTSTKSDAGKATTKPSGPLTATKDLCQKDHYKIGYDVFSATQPFANLVGKGLKDAAKKLGCVEVITTVDNQNGPVAVGNVKTMLNQQADGIVDFNVLAPYQQAISNLLKKTNTPGVAVIGADLPGYPGVGADNYGAAVINGQELAKAGKAKFGDAVPYLVVAAEPTAGEIVMQRYHGTVAGAKKVYPDLPDNHIIQVKADGTESGTYPNAVSALSRVPSGSAILTTAENDEVAHAMYKAAQARGFDQFLVNSFGGDPFGLQQVCADPEHYAGALFLEPEKWGESALVVVMKMINGESYPKTVGITGTQVTADSPEAGCK
ncbi:MAG TPA: substrate-binding domain-containing protein [Baekduia sp.]|nr:substrate-binding domain-containing protein [Baekduia sp.]